VAHRLKTVRGQLAAIDHITSTCERELLDDIDQQLRRLRAEAQLLESVA
jgi:DNA-binding FrmR family transcriptional regulator